MSKRLRFTLLGHPVAHSISPAICGAAFKEMQLPYTYEALDVPSASDLPNALDDLRSGRLAGANVTLPYKRAVLDLVDARAESAQEVGAANVITVDNKRRLVAHNTDAEALAAELTDLLGERRRFRAAIVGAGGAALAAIVACKRLGFKVVCVTSRSWGDSEQMFSSPSAEQARALGALTSLWPKSQEEVRASSRASQVLRLQWKELAVQADCVIQATSAGMHGADPGEDVTGVIPWTDLAPSTLVYDVVYRPRVTPFLARAAELGLPCADGLGMLVRQAALAIRLWTGEDPPIPAMRAAAELARSPQGSSPPPKKDHDR